jgi:hypothetical protein
MDQIVASYSKRLLFQTSKTLELDILFITAEFWLA